MTGLLVIIIKLTSNSTHKRKSQLYHSYTLIKNLCAYVYACLQNFVQIYCL